MRVREDPTVLIGGDDRIANGVIPMRTFAGRRIEVPGDHTIFEEPLIVQQGVRQSIGFAGREV